MNLYTLYEPSVVIVGDPVVLGVPADVKNLTITTPEPPPAPAEG